MTNLRRFLSGSVLCLAVCAAGVQAQNISDRQVFVTVLDKDGLPIEGLAFTDVGRFSMPQRLGAARSLLRNVGTGVRINAAGMIFELDAVRRFDAARGWTFSFNLRPGF